MGNTIVGGVLRLPVLLWSLAALGCVNDPIAGHADADDASDGGSVSDAAGTTDGAYDGSADWPPDPVADASRTVDLDPAVTGSPLTVRTCPGGASADCCPSALGFEDNSTMHFLTPACCRLALSNPQVVVGPTACGRGALRMDVDFRTANPRVSCGEPNEVPACAYQKGEISRAVLTSLDLTGVTMSVAVALDGPAPPEAARGWLFVLGRAGLIEGVPISLIPLRTWITLELALPNDGTGRGMDIRIVGVRIDGDGRTWSGQMYLDELTWR